MALADERRIFHDVYTKAQMISSLIRIFEDGKYLTPYDDTTEFVLTPGQKVQIRDRVKALYASIQTDLASSIIGTL